ncbi:M48 family metallopeptidase [Streptomyces sp. NPDC014983]|uniref:M48 family metallopeptidase n=1 Tax=Streptomyces sp. NPDC014983 TaxID=3364933 RepID=UPI0036F7DB36
MTALGEKRQDRTAVDGDWVSVDGLSLRVRASARRKRLALTVEPDATLTLHVPQGCPRVDAEGFVRIHREWVVSKLGQRERTRALNPAKRLSEGEVFRYLGRTYRLAVSDAAPEDGRARLVAGRLVIARKHAEDTAEGRTALVDWYCRVGRSWAANRLQPWAARMAVGEPELDVRELGQKWGAYQPGKGANGRGRMSLGWPLFQLPMHLVDYVVAHELAHVKVPGHGADFWRLVRFALPEYDERRAELDELGRRMWMGEIEG